MWNTWRLTSFWAVPEAKQQSAALVPWQIMLLLGHVWRQRQQGLLGALQAGLTGQGARLREMQDLSGWASSAGSTLAADALQPAGGAASGCGVKSRHTAGTECEHTDGRVEQQVLWDLLGYCMWQAEVKHCLTTICSKAWLGSSDRHVVWSADTAHVPFVA